MLSFTELQLVLLDKKRAHATNRLLNQISLKSERTRQSKEYDVQHCLINVPNFPILSYT